MTWPRTRTIHQVAVTSGRVRVWTTRHTPTGIRHDLTYDRPLAEVGPTEREDT